MRVSPSGKAIASQAIIRGFESHHPLFFNRFFRAVLLLLNDYMLKFFRSNMTHYYRVLYVEDNPENRLLIKRVLESDGFEVFEAESANEAWSVLNNHQIDLILIDINLPEVDGYSLTQKLKSQQKFQSTPIVALTANVMKGDREKSFQAGCDGYLQKPIDVDTFPTQIRSFLIQSP